MKCLIYLRVSTREQAEGYSIPAQKEACVKYIKEKGWNFVDEYIDQGESAKSVDRPKLQEMLLRIKEDNSIGAVVVHKIDRLARNMEDHVVIRALLRKNNIQLVSVTENIEDSASGRLVEGILAAMAEFYSSNLSSEVKKGMLQKLKQGGFPHRAPLGYKNVKENIKGREVAIVIPDKDKAPLVKQAYKLYATGNYSLRELREVLADKGFKTRSSSIIPKATLTEILQNKFYIGIVRWKGMEFKGNHKPLISKELFGQVQGVLRSHDYAGERKRKHPHYLRGTVFCGECGSRMSSQIAKKRYLYFYCLGQKRNNGCKNPYILATNLERSIELLYKNIQLPKELAEKTIEKIKKEITERESSSIKDKERFKRNLTKLNNQRYKLMEAYYNEAIPVEVLKKEQQRITDEIAKTEEKINITQENLKEFEKVLKLAIKLASNCYLAYQKASPQTKRLFNQAFFKKIYVKEKRIIKVDCTDFFDPIFNKSSNKDTLVGLVRLELTTTGPPARCATN
nr:recombinase family protein [Candidatus Aenigmarchaeota archaeon]